MRNKLDRKIIEITQGYLLTVTYGPITDDVFHLLTAKARRSAPDTVRESSIEFTPEELALTNASIAELESVSREKTTAALKTSKKSQSRKRGKRDGKQAKESVPPAGNSITPPMEQAASSTILGLDGVE